MDDLVPEKCEEKYGRWVFPAVGRVDQGDEANGGSVVPNGRAGSCKIAFMGEWAFCSGVNEPKKVTPGLERRNVHGSEKA